MRFIFSGAIGDGGNSFGLTLGASSTTTLVLSGTNAYTGATTVDGGTLLVNGSIAGSTVTVNAAGILAGMGTTGPVNVVAGMISPGASAGTLTTGSLTLDSNAIIKLELAQAGTPGGPNNDLLSVGGALSLDGTLQVVELPGFTEGTYRIADHTGALTNNGLALEAAFLAAHPGSFVDLSTANQVNLVVVPEPGSLTALLGGLGLLVGVQRHRHSRHSLAF